MAGVWMTPCKNGQCELSVIRDGIDKIVIATQTPLSDAQAEELFWCIRAMQRSGKTLKDLLKEQEEQIDTQRKNLMILLNKQEAVEPRRDANCVRMFRCGACGEYVGFIDSDPGDPNEQDNYCRNCGRKVKWND